MAFSFGLAFSRLEADCSIRMRMSWPRRLRECRGLSYSVLDSWVRGEILRARSRFSRLRSAAMSETRSLISISSRCVVLGIRREYTARPFPGLSSHDSTARQKRRRRGINFLCRPASSSPEAPSRRRARSLWRRRGEPAPGSRRSTRHD